ncbi:MAG: hypothetical protein QW279_15865 [Candidatus Jordarchaeaceae archaeon]
MKKQKKRLILTISIVIIFTGIVLASCSSIYTIKEEESLEESGVKYSISGNIKNGTKITRHFKLGEKMTIRFTHSLKPPYFDFYLINFTIIYDNSDTGATVFWFDLEPYYNPYSGQTLLVVKNLTIGKSSDDLDTSLTTQSNFIGKARKEGNYTLIFTSQYSFPVLSYMAFVKIVTIKEYPYATALPTGIVLTLIGITCTIWITFKAESKPRRRI